MMLQTSWMTILEEMMFFFKPQAFEDVGHSSTAMGMIESYLIGSIGDQARKEDEPPKPARDPLPASTVPERPEPATPSTSFMDIVLPLLILALAFAAWYYLTYINVNA
ncbi:hypothetical protein KSP39_PZI016105 [Platanthera zijinensis]|uniref:Uncharacterized protein n=1 Tax=Platanthera zijinensis TaxID=2320716 RepID=A0AAP0B981_9ASPA